MGGRRSCGAAGTIGRRYLFGSAGRLALPVLQLPLCRPRTITRVGIVLNRRKTLLMRRSSNSTIVRSSSIGSCPAKSYRASGGARSRPLMACDGRDPPFFGAKMSPRVLLSLLALVAILCSLVIGFGIPDRLAKLSGGNAGNKSVSSRRGYAADGYNAIMDEAAAGGEPSGFQNRRRSVPAGSGRRRPACGPSPDACGTIPDLGAARTDARNRRAGRTARAVSGTDRSARALLARTLDACGRQFEADEHRRRSRARRAAGSAPNCSVSRRTTSALETRTCCRVCIERILLTRMFVSEWHSSTSRPESSPKRSRSCGKWFPKSPNCFTAQAALASALVQQNKLEEYDAWRNALPPAGAEIRARSGWYAARRPNSDSSRRSPRAALSKRFGSIRTTSRRTSERRGFWTEIGRDAEAQEFATRGAELAELRELLRTDPELDSSQHMTRVAEITENSGTALGSPRLEVQPAERQLERSRRISPNSNACRRCSPRRRSRKQSSKRTLRITLTSRRCRTSDAVSDRRRAAAATAASASLLSGSSVQALLESICRLAVLLEQQVRLAEVEPARCVIGFLVHGRLQFVEGGLCPMRTKLAHARVMTRQRRVRRCAGRRSTSSGCRSASRRKASAVGSRRSECCHARTAASGFCMASSASPNVINACGVIWPCLNCRSSSSMASWGWPASRAAWAVGSSRRRSRPSRLCASLPASRS